VPSVGHESKRAGEQAEERLDDDEADVERDSHAERAIVTGSGVGVIMAVPVAAVLVAMQN
jgi:hypothetical protein